MREEKRSNQVSIKNSVTDVFNKLLQSHGKTGSAIRPKNMPRKLSLPTPMTEDELADAISEYNNLSSVDFEIAKGVYFGEMAVSTLIEELEIANSGEDDEYDDEYDDGFVCYSDNLKIEIPKLIVLIANEVDKITDTKLKDDMIERVQNMRSWFEDVKDGYDFDEHESE